MAVEEFNLSEEALKAIEKIVENRTQSLAQDIQNLRNSVDFKFDRMDLRLQGVENIVAYGQATAGVGSHPFQQRFTPTGGAVKETREDWRTVWPNDY